MKIINIDKATQRIINPVFDQIIDHISHRATLYPDLSRTDNGKGFSTMVYVNGDPDDPTIFTIQFFRARPVQVTAVIRGVEVGTMLYTSEDIPPTFQIILPDVL